MERSEPCCEAPSAGNNVGRRENLIAAGKEYRDLGFFTKALECYREAEKIQGDLDLSLKITSVINEQGRVPLASEEISKAMELYSRNANDTETIAVGELFYLYFDAVMKVRFGDALRLGCEILDHHVFNVPVEKLSGRKVCT